MIGYLTFPDYVISHPLIFDYCVISRYVLFDYDILRQKVFVCMQFAELLNLRHKVLKVFGMSYYAVSLRLDLCSRVIT